MSILKPPKPHIFIIIPLQIEYSMRQGTTNTYYIFIDDTFYILRKLHILTKLTKFAKYAKVIYIQLSLHMCVFLSSATNR